MPRASTKTKKTDLMENEEELISDEAAFTNSFIETWIAFGSGTIQRPEAVRRVQEARKNLMEALEYDPRNPTANNKARYAFEDAITRTKAFLATLHSAYMTLGAEL